MRYAIETYKFRGQELYRVIDTFNAGRVMERGISREMHAIGRRDELNDVQRSKDKRDEIAFTEPARVNNELTFAEESLKTPRDASAAATLIAAACFNDEIRAIVAAQLLRSIVRPHSAGVAMSLERAQDASSQLVTAFDRQYRD